jgi:hypothetical protein
MKLAQMCKYTMLLRLAEISCCEDTCFSRPNSIINNSILRMRFGTTQKQEWHRFYNSRSNAYFCLWYLSNTNKVKRCRPMNIETPTDLCCPTSTESVKHKICRRFVEPKVYKSTIPGPFKCMGNSSCQPGHVTSRSFLNSGSVTP